MTASVRPSCARAALFDSSRRDAPRPCAAEREPLVHGPTNCHADVSRRRVLARRSDAQTIGTVLRTCLGTRKVELHLRRKAPSLLARALLRSARHAAKRRGTVRPSVNLWRTAPRIATRMSASSASLLQLAHQWNFKAKSEANAFQPQANHDRNLVL